MSPDFSSPSPGHSATEPSGVVSSMDKKAPLWMAALATGVCVAAVSAGVDRSNRHTLETFEQPTAVGDRTWFPKTGAPRPPLRFQNAALREVSGEVEKIPDARMRTVGRTDDGALRLYVPEERAGGANEASGLDETGGPSWFVKTGPHTFLRLTR